MILSVIAYTLRVHFYHFKLLDLNHHSSNSHPLSTSEMCSNNKIKLPFEMKSDIEIEQDYSVNYAKKFTFQTEYILYGIMNPVHYIKEVLASNIKA